MLAIAVGIMLLSSSPVHAQVDTGSILGTVTDASGAVIGGATVTLVNEGTAATLSTTVDSGRQLQVHPSPHRQLQDYGYLPGFPDHGTEEHCGQRGRERGG